MHISLDSELGRQRRLNQIGESITQIAPDPAAAYSLRSLTGGDPKVVRVRRESDNDEQDFTASEVSSGAMVDFVNAQVTAPLDIQALTATGRDGDFLIAQAAYSLRSLGTRQATVSSIGDTDGDTAGKYVVQVRRSSDEKIKSFTADEITDGTLLSFVGTGGSDNGFVRIWYDQSVSDQAGSATGNHAVQGTPADQPQIVRAGSYLGKLDFDGSTDFLSLGSPINSNPSWSTFDVYEREAEGDLFRSLSSDTHTSVFGASVNGATIFVSNRIGFQSVTDPSPRLGDNLYVAINDSSNAMTLFKNGSALSLSSVTSQTNNVDFTGFGKRGTQFSDGFLYESIIYASDQTENRTAIEANIGEHYSIDLPSGVDPGFDQVNGFVETWYDQSGNGNDAVQATAANQPKIVNAGSFLTAGVTFDGGDSLSVSGDPVITASSSGTFSAFSVQTVATNEAGYLYGNAASSNGASVYALSSSKFAISNKTNVGLDNITRSSGQNLLSAVYNNGDAGLLVNGTGTMTDAGTYDFSASTGEFVIGNRNGGSAAATFLIGSINEIIIYNSNQSSNRTALETEIISHYGIS